MTIYEFLLGLPLEIQLIATVGIFIIIIVFLTS